MVDPPSVEHTIEIVKGLRSSYESHHHVEFADDVVAYAVRQADRYISDRYLPDKAIDVIDETGSRVHLARLSPPEEIGRIEAEIQEINRQKNEASERQDFEDAAVLRDKALQLNEQLQNKRQAWEEAVRDEVVEVTTDDIAEVIASMTGIPISRLAKTETERLPGHGRRAQKEYRRSKAGGHRDLRGPFAAVAPAYRIPSDPLARLSFSARRAWARPSWPSG